MKVIANGLIPKPENLYGGLTREKLEKYLRDFFENRPVRQPAAHFYMSPRNMQLFNEAFREEALRRMEISTTCQGAILGQGIYHQLQNI